MNNKEKARAYDEALNWMRTIYPSLSGADKEDAEHFFPELAESDERIRTELIDFIQWAEDRGMTRHDYHQAKRPAVWIAYLEKQKESKEESSELELKIPDWVHGGWDDEYMINTVIGRYSLHAEVAKKRGDTHDYNLSKSMENWLRNVVKPLILEKQKEESLRDFIDDFPYSDEQKEPENISASTMIPSCWNTDSLEEEVERYFYYEFEDGMTNEDIAYHFANWQRQKDLEENPKSSDSIPTDCVSNAKGEDRWHKVKDSLPDNTREVLCKDAIGNYFIGRYYSKGAWEISMYDDCDKSNEDNPPVVMWIDIPSEKQKEPHFTKRNALFDKCVENCDPEVMKKVSDEIDEMLQKEQKSFNVCEQCKCPDYNEQKPTECIDFDNQFENEISHLIASILNGEHEYNEGFVKYAAQSLLGYAKKEQKPAEWDELQAEFRNINEAFEDGKKEVVDNPEKYGLCKPAEWSDEDGRKIGTLSSIIFDYAFNKDALDENNDLTGEYAELDNWLKSLPERFNLQPKQEWSEEDEEKLKAICTYLRDYSRLVKLGDKLRFNEYCDFLESLRPQGSKDSLQTHWKPSEEQMTYLNECVIEARERHRASTSGYERYRILDSLYNDLKKL